MISRAGVGMRAKLTAQNQGAGAVERWQPNGGGLGIEAALGPFDQVLAEEALAIAVRASCGTLASSLRVRTTRMPSRDSVAPMLFSTAAAAEPPTPI